MSWNRVYKSITGHSDCIMTNFFILRYGKRMPLKTHVSARVDVNRTKIKSLQFRVRVINNCFNRKQRPGTAN